MSDLAARSWPSVAAFYRRLAPDHPAGAPMAALAEALAASSYAAALHPATSHAALLLGATPRFADHEALRVEYEPGVAGVPGEFVLSYRGGPVAPGWSTRTPDGAAGVARFLHHQRWAVEYRAGAA